MQEIRRIGMQAKIVNFLLIGVTLLAFILMHATNFMNSWYYQDILIDVYLTISVYLLAAAGYVFWKMKPLKMNGGLLMLLAGIASLVFAMMGMMLGIIIWILCGVSIRQINKAVEEAEMAEFAKSVTPEKPQDPFANGSNFGN